MLPHPTPKQIELHNQSRSFHAKIAQKASELRPAPAKTFSVPNAPYGIPKRGVRQLPSARYVQPAQFTLAYEGAWLLEICGVLVTDDFSSKQVMDRVKRTVAAFYNMTLLDLLSHRRTKPYVIPRQVAMYLCKTMTMRSLPEIGRAFADRDHTTILHAVRKIEGLIAADDQFAGVVAVLRTRCGGGK